MSKAITVKAAQEVHPLASAVLRQLGGGRDAIGLARDAANHGADGGFPGFTYSVDCRAFYRRNKKEINKAMSEMADDCGLGGLFDMVRGFGTFRHDESKPTDEEIGSVMYGDGSDAGDMASRLYDVFAWFALEEVGRAIVDQCD